MATEERSKETEEEVVYKTKVVKFLGRSTPIVLQNDNGPCPLLAICNVMLLRNNLSLSLDASEVSLQKLLSLVAERLIDSNSNVQDKDDEYVNNQQQNIADAIDLLPRLATGIDVNVQFRKINDFEFTRECAIFDLFDIGLFHGWIVDPQDTETAAVIGSKSYNTLVGELVAFQTRKSEGEGKSILEEDCVDFAAATTATLGVPSPSLSRGRSFDDSSVSVPVEQRAGRGDREEEVELMRALNLSRTHLSSPLDESLSPYSDWGNFTSPEESRGNFTSSEESTHFKRRIVADSAVGRVGDESDNRPHSDLFASPECNTSIDHKDFGFYSKDHVTENDNSPPKITAGNNIGQSVLEGSGNFLFSGESTENLQTDMLVEKQSAPFLSPDRDGSAGFSAYEDRMIGLREDQSAAQTCTEGLPNSQIDLKASDNQINFDSSVFSSPAAPCADLHTSDGRVEELDVSEGVTSSLEGSEPIYEGEECILDYGHPIYEDQEPVYEGEMILAEQADKREEDSCLVRSKEKVAEQKWRLIQNFLENNASQLTIYGLFCLQEGLNERELCVFFRNNHFSTMFKYNGELYLLATDQGYINQPDLVWEKLNEVNGDTMFVTGNFEEFKPENQTNGSWDEQNAMTTTADFIATLEGSAPASSILNSDLQLAIALQQQEFGQQHHSQKPQSSQQPSVSGRSRLVTGPQVPRNPNPPQKQEAKAKDKCVVM